MAQTPRCTACRTRKPLADFSPDRSRPSGHRPACKACEARRTADRRAGRPPRLRPPAPVVLTIAPEPVEPCPLDELIAKTERDVERARLVAEVDALMGRGPQGKALEQSLAALGHDALDAAAVALARTLARALDCVTPDDDSRELAALAARYGAALKSLGLTRDGARATRAPSKPSKLSRF